MVLIILSLVIIAIVVFFLLLMKDIGNSEYNVKDESEIAKQAEEKYLEEFSDYTDEKVKEEIGTITSILIDNQSSNRYTELLREKARKDKKIEEMKSAFLDEVNIIKYNKGNMKAKVKYRNLDTIYSIVLNLSAVTKGRLFLNDYFIYTEAVKIEE